MVFINKRLRVWKYTNTFEFYKCLNIVCRSCLFLYVTSHNVVIFYFSFILIHDPTKKSSSSFFIFLLRFVFFFLTFSVNVVFARPAWFLYSWASTCVNQNIDNFIDTKSKTEKKTCLRGFSALLVDHQTWLNLQTWRSVGDWLYCDYVILCINHDGSWWNG